MLIKLKKTLQKSQFWRKYILYIYIRRNKHVVAESQISFNTGSTGTYGGQKAEVTSSSAAYVTIELADGTTKTVSKNSPLFNFEPDPEVLARYDEKAERYHNLSLEAKKERKTLFAQMISYCSDLGVRFKHQMNFEQRAEYEGMQKQYYDAKMSAVSAGNRERSALLEKFIYLT